jgi:hypothetical protein
MIQRRLRNQIFLGKLRKATFEISIGGLQNFAKQVTREKMLAEERYIVKRCEP